MKRFIKLNLKMFMIFAIVFASIFGAKTFSKNKNNNITFANDNISESTENISIFIRKPTYSCFVDNKIYFIDEDNGSKLLKVYDTVNSCFEENYLNISDYEILDATFLDNCLYLIVSSSPTKNKIVKINLIENSGDKVQTKFEKFEYEYEFDSSYCIISTQNVVFNENDYLLVSLTSTNKSNMPILVLFDEQNSSTEIKLTFNLDKTDVKEINDNLIKTFAIQDDNLYVLFLYGSKISYVTINDYDALLAYNSTSQVQTIRNLTDKLSSTNSDYMSLDANFIDINGMSHIAVSYRNQQNNDYLLKIYPYILGDDSNTGFEEKKDITIYNANFALINGNIITCFDKQRLYYISISIDSPNYITDTKYADNPDCEISYFEEDKFLYKTTNSETKLLQKPWDTDEILTIDSNVDIIQIGTVSIKNVSRSRSLIKVLDYDYCLYTFNGKNYLGYIKNSDLVKKEEINLEDSSYSKIIKVWPETSIYSLPTNVTGSYITSDLVSEVLGVVQDNSRVEILDLISGYECNGKKFIKVLVNNSITGYIDTNRIYAPKDRVDYIVTNATIQSNNTKVYMSANKSSAVIYELSKGKEVRIDGTRDTKSGFTKITFNDEYGNEFTGYVASDYIKANAWSTMQIIGSILIAINIGLLILILNYKNKHINKDRAKVESNNE